jgi:folate-binding protein YgfZ
MNAVSPEGRWSALLSPSSVVVTSCLVRPVDAGYELFVPRTLGEAAMARLRRFHLRTDCTLELEVAEFGPFNTLGEQVALSQPGPDEFAAELTPQSYGAHFVASTISFTKGCFTGQELVGRLDARGSSVPWRLVRCQGPSLARIEEVLCAKGPDGPRGVTTAIDIDGSVAALGFIHRSVLAADVEMPNDVIVHEVE